MEARGREAERRYDEDVSLEAVRRNRQEDVASVLSNPNRPSEEILGQGLIRACKLVHVEIATMLLASVDVHIRNNNGEMALHCTVSVGHLDIARVLLNHYKADPNVRENSKGRTPLHLASLSGNFEMASILALEAQAHVNFHGHSVLSKACMKGNFDIARMLVSVGADVESTSYRNKTPLMVAVEVVLYKVALFLALEAKQTRQFFEKTHGGFSIGFVVMAEKTPSVFFVKMFRLFFRSRTMKMLNLEHLFNLQSRRVADLWYFFSSLATS
jgi:ankyrin repeat protein